ncbi:hypothetical protein [Acetobacter sp.]|uniref:hypothetical protein n=1 Tax=Acetobacter sp. TaxID=440 RepID=UPI0039EBB02C
MTDPTAGLATHSCGQHGALLNFLFEAFLMNAVVLTHEGVLMSTNNDIDMHYKMKWIAFYRFI